MALQHILGPQPAPPNQVSWMLNIGTHKKPADDEEYVTLANSLRQACNRVFERPDFQSQLFFPVTGARETLRAWKDPVFRTPQILDIRNMSANMVVERGARQRRIDAHILINVIHGPRPIQLEPSAFANMLQVELMAENHYFRMNDIFSRKPGYTNQYLAWPIAGRPYVYFRQVGTLNVAATHAYMTKQFNPDQTDQDQEHLNLLAPTLNKPDPMAIRNLVNPPQLQHVSLGVV